MKNMDLYNETQSAKNQYEQKRLEKEQAKNADRKKRTGKRVVFWIAVALIVIGSLFGLMYLAQKNAPNIGPGSLVDQPIGEVRAKGSPNAHVTLVEFSDFQCPACRSYFPIVKGLSEEFADNVYFIYRHFPLERIHKNAHAAGRAAEAAGNQGKFWEMHDMLFEKQQEWAERANVETLFLNYARSIGLNEAQFQNDFSSDAVKEKVEADFDSGVSSGVNATPTFFLNGTKVQNPRSYEEFRVLIQSALDTNS